MGYFFVSTLATCVFSALWISLNLTMIDLSIRDGEISHGWATFCKFKVAVGTICIGIFAQSIWFFEDEGKIPFSFVWWLWVIPCSLWVIFFLGKSLSTKW